MKRLPTLVVVTLMTLCAAAQPRPVDLPQYNFVKYKSNVLHYDSSSATMNAFFDKWSRMVGSRQGNINIVHIGGSHVQAGMLTNTVRCDLLGAYPDLVGPRGMIFPYSAAARCNNPADYRVRCPQKIGLTRNVHKEYAQPLGVCGIAVTAADTHTEMAIIMSEPRVGYSTKRVILLGHSNEGVMPRLRVEGREYYPSYIDNRTDRYLFNLNTAVDSFTVVLPCREGQQFTVSGIYLDNQRPGFSYSSIGVNGAAVPDYLRCTNFVRDLRLLHPDVVIFGIGINDAVPATFDTAAFRQNYLRLIDSVRAVNPSCAFIFITNNDSYIKATRRRYNVNPNGRLAREVFYRLAAETGGAVWDQFEVMGGLKSMEQWRLAGLAQTDRVHFTNAGYQLVGNLFYNALIDAYLKHSGRR
jgi:lysophospholipase L1-like esterase